MGLAARVSERQPNRSSRVGTDCYMAPEVINDFRERKMNTCMYIYSYLDVYRYVNIYVYIYMYIYI